MLLSIPEKMFCRMLLDRMKTTVDARLWDQRAGFGKDRSIQGIDQICTLRTGMELFCLRQLYRLWEGFRYTPVRRIPQTRYIISRYLIGPDKTKTLLWLGPTWRRCEWARAEVDSTRALERMGGATRSLGLVPRVMQRELGRERSKAGKFENGGSNWFFDFHWKLQLLRVNGKLFPLF